MSRPLSVTFFVEPDGHPQTVTGRDAWALNELVRAGESGVTPIDNPGPRWSAYVHNLRQIGVGIETLHERHGGDFAGTHARYVIRSDVTILERAHAEGQ